MLVYNFFGGPCSGKSTTAAYVFARFKNKGIHVELAREVAKDLIWEGRAVQLQRNQFLVSALQYSRLKDLKESGCELAITDSPVLSGLAFADNVTYRNEIECLLEKVVREFENVNVYLKRSTPYQQFGRLENEVEAKRIDIKIAQLADMDFYANGDEQGQILLFDQLWGDYLHRRNPKVSELFSMG